MAYPLTQTERAELENILDAARITRDYTSVYKYILFHTSNFNQPVSDYTQVTHDLLESASALDGVDKDSWLWARGAYGVNDPDENSPFSNFIREYTEQQFLLRYGGFLGDTDNNGINDLQDASNAIANRFALDILQTNQSNGSLPLIDRIGEIDAGSVASRVFDLYAAEGDGNFSPWAGTILFPYLGEMQFTRDGLFTTATNDFKKLSGTYDLISVVAVSQEIGDVSTSLVESMIDTMVNNSLGFFTTEAWLTHLRSEASGFFQSVYALPTSNGRFDIGGDLPLHASPSGLNFLNSPTYIVGTLFDDKGDGKIVTNDTGGSLLYPGVDIVHAGLGNDEILGSEGDDLIDGGKGIDSLSYLSVTDGLTVSIDDIRYWDDYFSQRIVVEDKSTIGGFIDYVYDIEKLTLTNSNDSVTYHEDVEELLQIDGKNGEDTFTSNGYHQHYGGNTIYISDEISSHHDGQNVLLNFENFNNGFYTVETLGNNFGNARALSYKSYEHSLDFNFSDLTISDGLEVDTFDGRLSLVGTDKGDTYRGSSALTSSHYISIFTGEGNDIVDGNLFHQARVFYGGGDDYLLNRESFFMPLGLRESDFSFSVFNRRIVAEYSNGNTVYNADAKIDINGYGSLFYEGQISYTYHENLDGYTKKSAVGSFATLFTEEGIINLSLDVAYPFYPSSPPTYEIKATFSRPESISENVIDGYYGTLDGDYIDLNSYVAWSNFYGFEGNDTIVASLADNVIRGGDGTDKVIFSGNSSDYTFSGDNSFIQLTHVSGPSGSDVLDNIEVIEFTDTVLTVDSLFSDNIEGTFSVDIVEGTSSGELIFGFQGNDTLSGFGGDDAIYGGLGDDSIRGDSGADIIYGEEGNDVIEGGGGGDVLYGGSGVDQIYGGFGADQFIIQSLLDDIDIIHDFSASEGDVIDVSSMGTPFLVGSILEQDGSNVRINFSNGAVLQINGTQASELASLIDQGHFIGIEKSVDGDITGDGYVGIEDLDQILAQWGQAVAVATGADLNSDGSIGTADLNIVLRNWGAAVPGYEAGTTIPTSNGQEYHGVDGQADHVVAGESNDTLYYSADAQWPSGFVAWNVGTPDAQTNGERITVNPRDRSHDIFDGGDGEDTLVLGDDAQALFLDDHYSASPSATNTARLVSIEIVKAGTGDDIIDLTSRNFSYEDIKLYGEEGNDVLWSSIGNDELYGGIGNDNLVGASGDDILVGGSGIDTMVGGAGEDTFVWNNADLDGSVDVIKDFDFTQDKLDISDILSSYDPLRDSISDFIATMNAGYDSETGSFGTHIMVQTQHNMFQTIVTLQETDVDTQELINAGAVMV